MPGIVGIIGPGPEQECQRLVRAMLQTMQHDPTYTSGLHFAPSVGAYGGRVSHGGSFAARQSTVRGRRGELLLFSGECFVSRAVSGGGLPDHALSDSDLLWQYEKQGTAFVAGLNGLFSGLLIDPERQSALLFNDRYGSERLYYAEKNGHTYFASETKALLRVLPELRALDDDGVAQFLRYGSTRDGRTLFRGIRLLPGATQLTVERRMVTHRQCYFSSETWEAQPVLSETEFESQFRAAFLHALPDYFASDVPVGVSITGGLDTRMILACMPKLDRPPISYTYGGLTHRSLDSRIGARVARSKGLDHHDLRIDAEFIANFGAHVDRTVAITDGCSGVLGAHEIHFSTLARRLSRVRLTGNFGSEILRGMSTFKPTPLAHDLLARDFRRVVDAPMDEDALTPVHPVTQAAFREIPWHLFGSLAAGRSQIVFRTPYLDNEIVRLAYRAPASLRSSAAPALRLIHQQDRALASIPTDRGLAWNQHGPVAIARRMFCQATFKLDYLYTEGLPDWMTSFDPILGALDQTELLGLHKFLPYRRWFRQELSGYARDVLTDAQTARLPYWNASSLPALIDDHVSGRHNRLRELNAVLSLEAIDRLLVREASPVAESAFIALSEPT